MRPTRSAGRRCRRSTATVTVLAASALAVSLALAGCGAPSASGSGAHAAKTATQARAGASPQPVTASASQTPLGASQVGSLAQVPWGQIGSGWALAEYTTGGSQAAGPVTLYLLDPEGGLYQLHHWPATIQPWVLVAWSGDKTRALFEQLGTSLVTLHQLTLATGLVSTFTLPADVTHVLGYTRPDGENILVAENGVVRYSLSGVLQARLSEGSEAASVVSAPDGLTEVVNGGTGVEVVRNSGGMVRFLPVPGTDATMGGCMPERWWNPADVLVACTIGQAIGPSLWLVPVSGAAPAALTPPRTDGPDFGDIDAWQLPTGLYLQAEAGCGPPYLATQGAGGSVQAVTVPDQGTGAIVVATAGSSMLIQQFAGCLAASSLSWFTPATNAIQPVLTPQPKTTGVVAAIPYDPDGEQPPAR